MSSWKIGLAVVVLVVGAGLRLLAGDESLQEPIRAIRAVGPDGKGAREAAVAWRELAGADVSQLTGLLSGMDGASPLARNWLRSAIDDVLARAHRDGKALPLAGLESFVRDKGHDPQARRFAYELVVEVDKSAGIGFCQA